MGPSPKSPNFWQGALVIIHPPSFHEDLLDFFGVRAPKKGSPAALVSYPNRYGKKLGSPINKMLRFRSSFQNKKKQSVDLQKFKESEKAEFALGKYDLNQVAHVFGCVQSRHSVCAWKIGLGIATSIALVIHQ